MALSWTLFPPTACPRFWLTTEIPSAFHATVLLRTSTFDELLTRIPAPQPQPGNPQPFSHTALFSMTAPSLISKKMPLSVLSWTLFPRKVTLLQDTSHQRPGRGSHRPRCSQTAGRRPRWPCRPRPPTRIELLVRVVVMDPVSAEDRIRRLGHGEALLFTIRQLAVGDEMVRSTSDADAGSGSIRHGRVPKVNRLALRTRIAPSWAGLVVRVRSGRRS